MTAENDCCSVLGCDGEVFRVLKRCAMHLPKEEGSGEVWDLCHWHIEALFQLLPSLAEAKNRKKGAQSLVRLYDLARKALDMYPTEEECGKAKADTWDFLHSSGGSKGMKKKADLANSVLRRRNEGEAIDLRRIKLQSQGLRMMKDRKG